MNHQRISQFKIPEVTLNPVNSGENLPLGSSLFKESTVSAIEAKPHLEDPERNNPNKMPWNANAVLPLVAQPG